MIIFLKLSFDVFQCGTYIVYLCKYFPRSRAFSLMCADYRVYAHISRRSRAVVASTCALLAYTGAHQVENIYKDEPNRQVYHIAIKSFFRLHGR